MSILWQIQRYCADGLPAFSSHLLIPSMLLVHRMTSTAIVLMRSFSARGLPVVALLLTAGLFGCAHDYERWLPNIPNSDQERVSAMVKRLPGDDQKLLSEWVKQGGKALDLATVSARGWEVMYRLLRVRAIPSHGPGADEQAVSELARDNTCRIRAMFRDEIESIQSVRPVYAHEIGLALSGGGIRSAAFATGVLKGLHEIGALDQVGYLSTVSGGGFAGAWYVSHEPDNDARLFAPGETATSAGAA